MGDNRMLVQLDIVWGIADQYMVADQADDELEPECGVYFWWYWAHQACSQHYISQDPCPDIVSKYWLNWWISKPNIHIVLPNNSNCSPWLDSKCHFLVPSSIAWVYLEGYGCHMWNCLWSQHGRQFSFGKEDVIFSGLLSINASITKATGLDGENSILQRPHKSPMSNQANKTRLDGCQLYNKGSPSEARCSQGKEPVWRDGKVHWGDVVEVKEYKKKNGYQDVQDMSCTLFP